MVDIPNTKYITIKYGEDGKPHLYVGGETYWVTVYRGTCVFRPTSVNCFFGELQSAYPEVGEVHIGAFNTQGKFAEVGEPSGNPGKYTWCRIVQKNKKTEWVCFNDDYTCSSAWECLFDLLHNEQFRLTVLGATTAAKKLTQYLSKIKLSQFVDNPVYCNGYKIVVEQTGEPNQR